MPTQRFEGATLDEAVQAAVAQAGPAAKIVGANRVRKGGLGGFFAREHVEVEVELEGGPSQQGSGSSPVPSRPAPPPPAPQGPARPRTPRAPTSSGTEDRRALAGTARADHDEDPMTSLIEEMAESGPSSILDLAERVNAQESRFSLSGHAEAEAATPPALGPTAPQADFATVLARIARGSGLVPSDFDDTVVADGGPGAHSGSFGVGEPVPAQHAPAILGELDGWREVVLAVDKPDYRVPGRGLGHGQDDELGAVLAGETSLAPTPPPDQLPAELPAERQVSNFAFALHQLGLPLPACQAVTPAASRPSLESSLTRTLRACLPPLPPAPRSASSVVAVVGPKGHVMATARALAEELGASSEVALVTKRKLWRQQDQVISSPEMALEHRRSWRWRSTPSVVAVEHDVRPGQAVWAAQVLKALEPTLCWGVASAAHKPEDLAAWSEALGGLDAIALVDLEATTTPAAALASDVPVGSLDGAPATPEQWAKVLCDRLLG